MHSVTVFPISAVTPRRSSAYLIYAEAIAIRGIRARLTSMDATPMAPWLRNTSLMRYCREGGNRPTTSALPYPVRRRASETSETGGTVSTPGFAGLPGMAQQFGLYFSTTAVADPDALYLVWGGANDFLTFDSPITAAQNMANYVGGLAAINAVSILVPNIPDLSLTPFINVYTPGLAAVAQGFSLAFNAELASQLDIVSGLFPATNIIEYDIFALFNDVVADPPAYGFTDVTNACLLVGCSNPDEFLFWDDFHPTTRGHAIIASELAAAVPAPASLVLICLGLAGIGYQRRKQIKAA